MTQCVKVAVAVIENAQGQVLLTKRAEDKHQGGLWEFPGGKLEPNETGQQALARELKEELGIEPLNATTLIQIPYQYPELQVLLKVYRVTRYLGQAHSAEGQPMQWVPKEQLAELPFPAANRPIITAAQLPDRYLITPAHLAAEALYDGVIQAAKRGIRLIQLRAPKLAEPDYFTLVGRILHNLPADCRLLIKGSQQQVEAYPQAGWHLSSQQLMQLTQRPLPAKHWLAASCHDAAQLQQAAKLEIDFACLSPVLPTATHPQARPLGWETAACLLAAAQLPVYLLGGMQPAHQQQAQSLGAQGIAGIRGLWE